MVFGDAGSATALVKRAVFRPGVFVLGTDGRGAENLIVHAVEHASEFPTIRAWKAEIPLNCSWTVGGVQLHAFRGTTARRTAISGIGRSPHNTTRFCFISANTFMIKHLAKKMKLESGQGADQHGRFGNTKQRIDPHS
jgi:3-oxoacyl-[acyl-carrier-protein] synthase-3